MSSSSGEQTAGYEMNKRSLQINLSPGDVRYAEITVPALVESHRERVEEVFVVVDCCRPQKTKIFDPDLRLPLREFQERVDCIRQIAQDLKNNGLIDRIEFLEPESPLFQELSKKYLSGVVTETHDYGGCALMSYLAAIELARHRFVLHYDADMLLYQAPGYDWSTEAVEFLEVESKAIAAIPRISPPRDGKESPPSRNEWPIVTKVLNGFRDSWFSTQCFILDREKLARYLPLLQGRALLEVLFVKFLKRGYPRSPEVMLSKRLSSVGAWRLNLASTSAWLLHPRTKTNEYIELLPKIVANVCRGIVPADQLGNPDLDIQAWRALL